MVNSKSLLEWSTENNFSINGVNFISTVDPQIYHALQSKELEFLIVKTREMIERELDEVQNVDDMNIVDIGIWQGGSVVLWDLVFAPRKLVALEYSKKKLPSLDSYISSRGRLGKVCLYNGVNQGDANEVERIMKEEFNDEPIDLVIDDASHFYDETRASFNVLFPRLREGGKFIIEDWQWSTNADIAKLPYFKDKPSLSNLILQCILLCATRQDIISSVTVYPHMAIVTRGRACDLRNFSIADFATNRGAPVELLL